MSEEREVPYDELPAYVRADLEGMRKKLGPELKFGRVTPYRGGWIAMVCTLDGTEGGQYVIMNLGGAPSA